MPNQQLCHFWLNTVVEPQQSEKVPSKQASKQASKQRKACIPQYASAANPPMGDGVGWGLAASRDFFLGKRRCQLPYLDFYTVPSRYGGLTLDWGDMGCWQGGGGVIKSQAKQQTQPSKKKKKARSHPHHVSRSRWYSWPLRWFHFSRLALLDMSGLNTLFV